MTNLFHKLIKKWSNSKECDKRVALIDHQTNRQFLKTTQKIKLVNEVIKGDTALVIIRSAGIIR